MSNTPSSIHPPDANIGEKRLVEWHLKEKEGNRSSSDGSYLKELGGSVSGGNLGASFKAQPPLSCLWTEHRPEWFAQDGVAIALLFRIGGEPGENGRTIIKSWLFDDEQSAFFSDHEKGLIFAIQLIDNSHQLRVIFAPDEGYQSRVELIITEEDYLIAPDIDYFLVAQYNARAGLLEVFIMSAGSRAPLQLVRQGPIKPLCQKRVPLQVGLQELGRPGDPEPFLGNIQRLGLYQPLTPEEVEVLAWEYGLYPYDNQQALVERGVTLLEDFAHYGGKRVSIRFPRVRERLFPTSIEKDILASNHLSLVQSFLNQVTEGFQLYRYAYDPVTTVSSWTSTDEQDIRNTAGETNHTVLENVDHYDGNEAYLGRILQCSMLAVQTGTVTYDSTFEGYSGEFAIAPVGFFD